MPTVTKQFLRLEDSRRYDNLHQLLDILATSTYTAICGPNVWEDVDAVCGASLGAIAREAIAGGRLTGSPRYPEWKVATFDLDGPGSGARALRSMGERSRVDSC